MNHSGSFWGMRKYTSLYFQQLINFSLVEKFGKPTHSISLSTGLHYAIRNHYFWSILETTKQHTCHCLPNADMCFYGRAGDSGSLLQNVIQFIIYSPSHNSQLKSLSLNLELKSAAHFLMSFSKPRKKYFNRDDTC